MSWENKSNIRIIRKVLIGIYYCGNHRRGNVIILLMLGSKKCTYVYTIYSANFSLVILYFRSK